MRGINSATVEDLQRGLNRWLGHDDHPYYEPFYSAPDYTAQYPLKRHSWRNHVMREIRMPIYSLGHRVGAIKQRLMETI